MTKIIDLTRKRPVIGDVGIEIEVEGRALPEVMVNLFWKVLRDASLRGGLEYTLIKPIPIDLCEGVLEELSKEFVNAQSKLSFSFRTSVHVHVNVQQLEYNQLLNFIYTYALLEEVLMDLCGESRKANRFCLRIKDAEYILEIFNRLFASEGKTLNDIPNNQVRYSALNLEAIKKFGSLEFRGMEGNFDVARISQWCRILVAMREWACKFANPYEVYEFYMQHPEKDFLSAVLGDLAGTFNLELVSKPISESFSMTIDLPFEYKRVFIDAPKPRRKVAEPTKLKSWDELVGMPPIAPPRLRRPDMVVMDDIAREELDRRIDAVFMGNIIPAPVENVLVEGVENDL